MRATLAWTAIALIFVGYTVPALIAFWKGRNDEPPEDEMRRIEHGERPSPSRER